MIYELLKGRNPLTTNMTQLLRPEGIAKYHWKPDRPDSRDHLFTAIPAVAPAGVDLRTYASPIEDQGQIGSCTGNAIAGAIELIDNKAGKRLDVSRLFIYYEERVLEGSVNYDAGAYIRDGIKVCYTKGAPLESLWPYNVRKWSATPPTAAYNDALKRKVTGYQRCANFTAVKNALALGNPVVIGFNVYASFEQGSWQQANGSGLMPYPAPGEQLLGGHAVLIVGYNDSTQRFIVKNSWGTSWADKGYFYMPYQVIQNTAMSSDFWVISAVKNP
jgi:C1A family cysteine protease